MTRRRFPILFAFLAVFSLTYLGCHTIPSKALTLTPESLQDRQLQTRLFQTTDEKMLLSACAALLQDLGYQLDESEASLGVLVGSRDRNVVDAGEVFFAAILAGLSGARVPVSRNQKVMASVVTKPMDGERIAVRVTFQHMVWNTDNQIIKNEQINDQEIYEEFFSKLSKSVFLEANNI